MYEDLRVIDEYLSLHSELSEEHQKIIAGWKKCIRGTFVIERRLKKGSM